MGKSGNIKALVQTLSEISFTQGKEYRTDE